MLEVNTFREATAPLVTPNFWLSEALKVFFFYLVAYLSALLVIRWDVRVNYTRKINHMALFFLPMLLYLFFNYEGSELSAVVSGSIFLLTLLPFHPAIRQRLPLFETMFRSYDRPEDRPHTLVWLVTQVLAGYLVLFPLLLVYERLGVPELILIPVLINALGDGLAEPVGVRFGKRHYRVRALFTDKRYTRTLEGSACVFVSGVLAVLLFAGSFSSVQLFAALLLVPILTTLAEAWAPHTWDTPFIFLVGGGSVLLILAL